MKKNKTHIILCFFLALTLVSCNKNTDPVTGEPQIYEPNPEKRARAFADKGGGLFGDINKMNKTGNNFEFATSNPLWRATLKSLEFLPLFNVDYAGGIILTDWYSNDLNSNEQIKITVRFLSNELRSSSLNIIAHKKICDTNNNCKITKLPENFSQEIKESIINSARSIKIEDEKKK
jgi:hypothetical protein